MDLASIKNEIDEFVKISNENTIDLSNIKPLIEKSIPNLVELEKEENMIQSEYFESKINDIYKVESNLFTLKVRFPCAVRTLRLVTTRYRIKTVFHKASECLEYSYFLQGNIIIQI